MQPKEVILNFYYNIIVHMFLVTLMLTTYFFSSCGLLVEYITSIVWSPLTSLMLVVLLFLSFAFLQLSFIKQIGSWGSLGYTNLFLSTR